jgi:hypothetical protein
LSKKSEVRNMGAMSVEALVRFEKLCNEIDELKFKVMCLEAIVEALVPKEEKKCTR